MISKMKTLTGREIDFMDRAELIAVLRKRKCCVRTEFTRQWLDRQSTESLRLLVFAVELYRALQFQARRREATGPAA